MVSQFVSKFTAAASESSANRNSGVLNPFIPIGPTINFPSLAGVFTLSTVGVGLSEEQRASINCVQLQVDTQALRFLFGENPTTTRGFILWSFNASSGVSGTYLLRLHPDIPMPRFIEAAIGATGLYQFGRLL